MKSFDDLMAKVTSLTADAGKATDGNKSAGVRLRAGMQDVKRLADGVRKEVLTLSASAITRSAGDYTAAQVSASQFATSVGKGE